MNVYRQFNMDKEQELTDCKNLANTPIPKAESAVLDACGRRNWKSIPIIECLTTLPKALQVIPNTPFHARIFCDGEFHGKATAWPAYYRTVSEENEANPSPRGFGELARNMHGEIQSSPLVKVRPEIKAMLDQVQKILNSNPETAHLQLVVIDGYRRIQVQERLFLEYKNFLRKLHPTISEEELDILAQQMVSMPPKNLELLKTSPPPHSTGGAVDVILVEKSKIDVTSDYWLQSAMIDFGADFDEMMHPTYQDARSFTRFYEEPNGNEEARKNRRLLYNLMTQVGFTNYPFEFWHYDFGNQSHALCSGGKEAAYGFAGGLNDRGEIVEDLSAEEATYAAYAKIVGEIALRVRHHFGLAA